MRLLRRVLSVGTLCVLAGLAGGLVLGYVLGQRGEWLVATPWLIYLGLLLLATAGASWLDLRFRGRPRTAPAQEAAPVVSGESREPASASAQPVVGRPAVREPTPVVEAPVEPAMPLRVASDGVLAPPANPAGDEPITEPAEGDVADEAADERAPIPLRPRGATPTRGPVADSRPNPGAAAAVPRPIRADMDLPHLTAREPVGGAADKAADEVEEQ